MSSPLKAPPPVALTTAFPPSAPRCRRFCSMKFRHCSILEASNFWKCKRPPPSIGGGSAENLRLGSTSGEKYTNLTSEPPISENRARVRQRRGRRQVQVIRTHCKVTNMGALSWERYWRYEFTFGEYRKLAPVRDGCIEWRYRCPCQIQYVLTCYERFQRVLASSLVTCCGDARIRHHPMIEAGRFT